METVISLLKTKQKHKEKSYISNNLRTIVAAANCALICDISKILEIDGNCGIFYGDCKKMQIQVQDALEELVVDLNYDREILLNILQRVKDNPRLQEEKELRLQEEKERIKEEENKAKEDAKRCWDQLFKHDCNRDDDYYDNAIGGYQCSICSHISKAREEGMDCDNYVGKK